MMLTKNNLLSLLYKLPEFAAKRSPYKGGICSFCNAKTKVLKLLLTKLKLIGFIFTKIEKPRPTSLKLV